MLHLKGEQTTPKIWCRPSEVRLTVRGELLRTRLVSNCSSLLDSELELRTRWRSISTHVSTVLPRSSASPWRPSRLVERIGAPGPGLFLKQVAGVAYDSLNRCPNLKASPIPPFAHSQTSRILPLPIYIMLSFSCYCCLILPFFLLPYCPS